MAFYNQGPPMAPHGAANPSPVHSQQPNPFLPHNGAPYPYANSPVQQPAPMQPQPYMQPMQPQQPQEPQQPQQPGENQPQAGGVHSVFGALALGYPDTPWTCSACTLINVADRLECAACDTERPPLNVGAANARTRDPSYFNGRTGWQGGWNWTAPTRSSLAGPGSGQAPAPDRQPTMDSQTSMGQSHVHGPGGPGGPDEAKDLASVGCLSQEQVSYVLSYGLLFYQAFKTVMACLLSLFVPQYCEGVENHPDPFMANPHDCTMEENFEDLTNFNILVTSWNFITLAACFIQYYVVLRRERTLIEWLDEDPTVTNDYLVRKNRRGQTVIEMYPRIQAAVRKHNTAVLITSVITILLFIVNILMSAVLCFRDYYAGYRSVTVFLTNISLTSSVILAQCNQAYTGVETGIALSMFKSDPAVYNAIDRRLRSDPEFFVPRKKASKDTQAIEMNETTYRVK